MNIYLLISLLLFAILIIFIIYMILTKSSTHNPNILNLNTEEDKILTPWFDKNIRLSYNLEIIDDLDVAQQFLERLFNIKIDKNKIVIGHNLTSQYYNLTNNIIDSNYHENKDTIFLLRDILGISGNIAIIHDLNIRNELAKKNHIDLTYLKSIIDNELDIIARDYLKKILIDRWNTIKTVDNLEIINSSGSFLYLKTLPTDNIKAFKTNNGFRINLLCTNTEFDTLIDNLKSSQQFYKI